MADSTPKRVCTRGHPITEDGSPRLPCGCYIGTASDEALLDQGWTPEAAGLLGRGAPEAVERARLQELEDADMNRGDRPDMTQGEWKTLVQLSAEDTARWLAGEDVPWSKGIVDPELRREFDEAKDALLSTLDLLRHQSLQPSTADGLYVCALAFASRMAAPDAHAPMTSQRIRVLMTGMREGSSDAERLLRTMLAELTKFAMDEEA